MSRADKVFKENIKEILTHGYRQSAKDKIRAEWPDGSPAPTVKVFGLCNRYDLSEEFPIMTIRRSMFKDPIREMLWIWQKKSNSVAESGLKIWDAWARADGTIGKAYGYQMAKKYRFKEGESDIVDHIIYLLKNDKNSRRMVAHMYNYADLTEMALEPCAYSMTFNVSGNKLNAVLNQRSQDMIVANGWNVVQYAVLLHIFAAISGLEAGELMHVIADAHIYDRHIPIAEELLAAPCYDAPEFVINKKEDFYAYTPDDFQLKNYRHGKDFGKFEVAE